MGHVPADKTPTELVVNVYNLNKTTPLPFTITPTSKFKVPLHLTPGHNYKVVVEAKLKGEVVAEGKLFHRAGNFYLKESATAVIILIIGRTCFGVMTLIFFRKFIGSNEQFAYLSDKN